MKRSTVANTLSIAVVGTLALSLAPGAKADDKGCSNASLRGTFAYTSTGSLVAPPVVAGPYAEVGALTFDGQGAINGVATLSQNGNIVPVTITGTYVVNPDCTGTFAAQMSPIGVTAHFLFVIDDTGDGFQAICLDSGAVITRIGRRLFQGRAI